MSIEDLRSKKEEYLTAVEVAKALGVSKKIIYQNAETLPFPIFKIGKSYRIPKNPFIEFLQKGCIADEHENSDNEKISVE